MSNQNQKKPGTWEVFTPLKAIWDNKLLADLVSEMKSRELQLSIVTPVNGKVVQRLDSDIL